MQIPSQDEEELEIAFHGQEEVNESPNAGFPRENEEPCSIFRVLNSIHHTSDRNTSCEEDDSNEDAQKKCKRKFVPCLQEDDTDNVENGFPTKRRIRAAFDCFLVSDHTHFGNITPQARVPPLFSQASVCLFSPSINTRSFSASPNSSFVDRRSSAGSLSSLFSGSPISPIINRRRFVANSGGTFESTSQNTPVPFVDNVSAGIVLLQQLK